MSPSYKGPNFHVLHGYYLTKTIDEMKIYVESYRETWKKTSCTLMVDGLTNQKKITLINFLLYYPQETFFFKQWMHQMPQRLLCCCISCLERLFYLLGLKISCIW